MMAVSHKNKVHRMMWAPWAVHIEAPTLTKKKTALLHSKLWKYHNVADWGDQLLGPQRLANDSA
jgi:hypothetical protein